MNNNLIDCAASAKAYAIVVRHFLQWPRLFNAVLFVLVSVTSPVLAHAESTSIQSVDGKCAASSHTAEGPLGDDLTKREARFYCDVAAITFFDDYKGHVMVQFVQKEANHTPILAFAGRVHDDGIIMDVEKVYLEPGQASTVSDGACKFFFKEHNISGIACGMKLDETGRRTVAVVAFDAKPGQ